MKHHHDHNRRQLLKSGLGLAMTGSAAFALNLTHMTAAAAQTARSNDYKALVCLFMHGGNDQANTIIATSGDSWRQYENMRGGSIGLQAPGSGSQSVLPIQPGNLGAFGNQGLQLALHPRLTRARELFRQRRLAILSNVGPLIEPTSAEQFRQQQTRIPRHLFSHNDQQATWQTFSPEGNHAGWGGRMLDLMANTHNASALFASAISPGINADAWLTGQMIKPYSIPLAGDVGVQIMGTLKRPSISQAIQEILSDRRADNLLGQTYAELHGRTLEYQARMQSSLVPDNHASLLPAPTLSSGSSLLAQQIRAVARMIASRNNLGVRRQIFFINLGGFDTHDSQISTHDRLMTELDIGLDYFDRQMKALGVENQVTLFTASDFGRTMTSNGTGTDHGWGAHHFIYGGAVNGGNLYGRFPTFGLDAGDDVDGRLVPQYSVEQYAAALGKWFGLSQGELLQTLPNLINFTGAAPLNFMKA